VGRAGPQGSSVIRHFARQSTLLLTSGVLGYAGTFGLTVLLARVVGAHGLGLYVIASAAAQIVSVYGLMGADWILVRHGSHYHGIGDRERLRATIRLAFVLGGAGLVVLGAGLSALAPLLGHSVYHARAAVTLLRLAGPWGALMGFGNLMLYGTMAFKSMRAQAFVRNLLQPVIRLAFVGAALIISPTPLAAFVAVVIAEVLLLGVATHLLNRRISLAGETQPIDRRAFVRFAIPASANRLAQASRGQVFPLLLGSLGTVAAPGVWQASRRIALAPSSIIWSMSQVYNPIASDLYLQGLHDDLAALFKSMGKWCFAIGFAPFCVAVFFPRELLSVFGHVFEGAATPLIVLSIGMLFEFGTGPVSTTLILIGHPKLVFADYLVVLVVEIAIGVWLIPGHGVLGAAIARSVGAALNNVLLLGQVWAKIRLHPFRVDYWKPLAAGLLAGVGARVVLSLAGMGPGVGAAAVAAAAVGLGYLALLLAFGLTADDKEALNAIFRRRGRHSVAPAKREGSRQLRSERPRVSS
jgi:O-antigen/teichoic acid export membrane protein